jgi:hypothetical protein
MLLGTETKVYGDTLSLDDNEVMLLYMHVSS